VVNHVFFVYRIQLCIIGWFWLVFIVRTPNHQGYCHQQNPDNNIYQYLYWGINTVLTIVRNDYHERDDEDRKNYRIPNYFAHVNFLSRQMNLMAAFSIVFIVKVQQFIFPSYYNIPSLIMNGHMNRQSFFHFDRFRKFNVPISTRLYYGKCLVVLNKNNLIRWPAGRSPNVKEFYTRDAYGSDMRRSAWVRIAIRAVVMPCSNTDIGWFGGLW